MMSLPVWLTGSMFRLGGLLSRGLLSRGLLSGGSFSRRVSVQGGLQWRIHDFSEGGAPTTKLRLFYNSFGEKLHENERIWTPSGRLAFLVPPLDPPMVSVQRVSVWGVSVRGVSDRDPPGKRPPQGDERAVRILLKFFLVSACVLHFQINLCRSKNRHLPRKNITAALYDLQNSAAQ